MGYGRRARGVYQLDVETENSKVRQRLGMRVISRVMKPAMVALGLALLLGTAAPASAQIDLSGIWAPLFHEDQPERIPGPDIGDYAGLPITDAARLRGETWNASLLTLPEHQCKPHPSTYGFRGVGNLRISNAIDDVTQQLVSIRTHIQW